MTEAAEIDKKFGENEQEWKHLQDDLKKLGDEFNKKYGADPRENIRCRLRMLETIEKARKLLSGDTEASVNIDYLLNEEDLNRKMKRDEFEQLIDPHVRSLTTLLRETLAESGKFA